MFDYIVLPTCTFAEYAALPLMASTPVQTRGYKRVRLSEAITPTENIIIAPEGNYQIGVDENESPIYLGVFI